MKVVHLVAGDHLFAGGTSIAASSLSVALRDAGQDSRILTLVKETDSPFSKTIGRSQNLRRADHWAHRVGRWLGFNDLLSPGGLLTVDEPMLRRADVVHVHNVRNDVLSLAGLARLSRCKPTVLTLHDTWTLTGHCITPLGCERWRTGCGACPHLDIPPPIERDRTAQEWRIKRSAYARMRLDVIAPSRWIADFARASILSSQPVHEVGLGLDLERYRPIERVHARKALGLDPGRPTVIFAAEKLSNPVKGFDLLTTALAQLPSRTDGLQLLMFGKGTASGLGPGPSIDTVPLGVVGSDRVKGLAYAAADAFVLPSRGENAGLVAMESIACGTPVAAFSVGGIPDSVVPGETGALAEPENPADLARAINELLSVGGAGAARLRASCRRIAEARFDIRDSARAHVGVYERAISREATAP